MPQLRAFRIFLSLVPVAMILIGIGLVVASRAQTGGDQTAASAYGADASCTAALEGPVPSGACSVVPATLREAAMESVAGSTRGNFGIPTATIAFADGRVRHVSLVGNAFFHAAYPGNAILVQRFEGKITRLGVSGTPDSTSDTTENPIASAQSDASLFWYGLGAIVIGAFALFASLRMFRIGRSAV